MIIYKDMVTGDQVISDQYNLIDVNDTVYEVNCTKFTVNEDTFEIDANGEPGTQEISTEVVDVVHKFRLGYVGDTQGPSPRPITDKKDYTTQLRKYVHSVALKMTEAGKSMDEVKSFETGVETYFVKVINPNFTNYDFYTGTSMAPDGMVILLSYRGDGTTPYLTYWKHGLVGTTAT